MQPSTIGVRRRQILLATLPFLALGLAGCADSDPIAPTADPGPGTNGEATDEPGTGDDGGTDVDITGQGGTWDGEPMDLADFDQGDGAPGVFTGAPGECVEITATDMLVIDCTQPHHYEIYYTFNVTAEEFPGEDAIIDEARRACPEFFEPYVGVTPDQSIFLGDMLHPSQDTWEQAGDSEVICLLANEELREGSAFGTAE